jgi:hypothetical protein
MRLRGAVALPLALVAAASAAVPDPAAPVDYSDASRAVSAVVPDGWHRARTLTALAFPREVVTIASFPLRRGGSCAPTRALADLGPRDALVSVVEYRPQHGGVWSAARRAAFPPRPRHLRLPRRAGAPLECFGRPGRILRFRDADRPLQVVVVLGARASQARRHAVQRVLDGLRFGPLPATADRAPSHRPSRATRGRAR